MYGPTDDAMRILMFLLFIVFCKMVFHLGRRRLHANRIL